MARKKPTKPVSKTRETSEKKAATRKIFKPTQALHAEIVEQVRKLVESRVLDGDVKRVISTKYGLAPRSVERYLRRAREVLLAETQVPIEEHRAGALGFYLSRVRDPKASDRDRIRAQERIDKLLGLEIKEKPQDDDGFRLHLTPEQLAEMSDEELEALRRRVAPRH